MKGLKTYFGVLFVLHVTKPYRKWKWINLFPFKPYIPASLGLTRLFHGGSSSSLSRCKYSAAACRKLLSCCNDSAATSKTLLAVSPSGLAGGLELLEEDAERSPIAHPMNGFELVCYDDDMFSFYEWNWTWNHCWNNRLVFDDEWSDEVQIS